MSIVIPVGIEFSPHTTLASGFDSTTATECEPANMAAFPTLSAGQQGVIVLCVNEFASKDPADYEVMTYNERDAGGGLLKGLTHRAGTARTWPAGTYIACYMTGWAWEQMRAAVVGHFANTTDPHGAVSAATADKILIRDGDGRARVAAPAHNDDIARKLEVDARVAKAGDTMSGELNMADNLLTRPKIKDYGETAVIETAITGAKTIDLEAGNYHRHTYTGDVTYTFSNPPASGTAGSFTLVAVQGATLRDLTFPVSVTWAGGSAPEMIINKKYYMTFITDDGGTSWSGFLAGEV